MKHYFSDWVKNCFLNTKPANAEQLFSWQQILMCASLMLIVVISLIILSKCSKKTQNIVLYIAAALLLVFETLRYFWLGFVKFGGWSKFIFHFNLCNILAIFIPLSIFVFKNRTCYAASFLYGLIGGLVVMVYPRDVVGTYYLLHVMVAQSLISHALFIFIAILLVMSGKYSPNFKTDWWQSLIVVICFSILAKIMVHVYNGEENFMFMRELDFAGLNFVPFWVYYPILIILVAAISTLLLWGLQKALLQIKRINKKETLTQLKHLI